MPDESLVIYRTWDQPLGSLWLKTIRAVDLNQHCLPSLIGDRIPVDRQAGTQTIRLNQFDPAPAYYLCGLPYPYRWELNGHLVAVPAPGEQHEWVQPCFEVVLTNLRPVPEALTEDWVDTRHPQYPDRYFRTCRNWRAAWWAHKQLRLENRHNSENDRWRYRTRSEKKKPQKEPELW